MLARCLKFVFTKWLQSVIDKWERPKCNLVKLVWLVWMGYRCSCLVTCNHAPFLCEEMAKSKIATIAFYFLSRNSITKKGRVPKNIMYFLLLKVFVCILLLNLIIDNSRGLFSRLSRSNWCHCWGTWMSALPQWNVYTSKIRTWKSILGLQSVSRRLLFRNEFDINSSYNNRTLHFMILVVGLFGKRWQRSQNSLCA